MLELFIGLSIDFILVKSWWFDKAKLIKHRRSTLMLAAWSLLKRKKTFNEQKMLPRFFKLTLWRKKTKHSLITFPLHTKLNYFSYKLFWEKGKTHIAENKKKSSLHPWYFHVPLLSHNLQILQHNHSIHKHKSKHWQCCVRDLAGCASNSPASV